MSEKEAFRVAISRTSLKARLKDEQFDVLIIGGGATGAGSALEAASRGLKTALVEAHDFAFGTSSRSTKLVHGGIRYLENAVKHLDWQEYELVRDALHERKHFLQNAPHLTNPLPIITPVYSWFAAFYYWVGLKMYDVVAGKASLGASRFLSKNETLKRFPLLKTDGLKGAVLYYDGQFNDARMNVTLITTAIQEGAAAVNYVRVKELIKKAGKVVGALVVDELTHEEWPIYARVVVNATGPYADVIRTLDNEQAEAIMVASQGTHILLPEEFCVRDRGMVIPDTKDGRVLFVLPWLGKTLAGTTDQPQVITEFPKASEEEVDYIIEHLQKYLAKPISKKQVMATWSGLRPLAKPDTLKDSTASISRDHLIEISPSNLVTIVGGKWTTYRKMGQDLVESVMRVGNLEALRPTNSKNLKLIGAHGYSSIAAELTGLECDIREHLAHAYGDRAGLVLSLGMPTRLVEGFPFIESEILYALRYEYALSASDILARRMRLAFLDQKAAIRALPKVVQVMAKELQWDAARILDEERAARQFLATMLVS